MASCGHNWHLAVTFPTDDDVVVSLLFKASAYDVQRFRELAEMVERVAAAVQTPADPDSREVQP